MLGGSHSPLFIGAEPNSTGTLINSDWPAIAAGTLINSARLFYVDEVDEAPETETLEKWVPLLESTAQAKESLVIISSSFRNSVLLATLIVNRIRGTLNCAVVKPTGLSTAIVEILKPKSSKLFNPLHRGTKTKVAAIDRESLVLAKEVWIRRDSAVAFFEDESQITEHLVDIMLLEVGGKNIPDIRQRQNLVSEVIEDF